VTLLVAASWDSGPWVERFRALLPGRKVVVPGEPFDRRAVYYVATWGPKPGSLSGLPNLAAIFSLGAGVDHLMSYPDLPDVPIVRVAQDDLTRRMSEYVVLHCLIALRDQRRLDAQQRARQWRDDVNPPKLATLGFDVAGWSRTAREVAGVRVYGADEFDAFLARTDILVSLLPLTPQTRGILNRDLFARLSHTGRLGGPVLINAGRGGLQVEADILACLDDGTLKSATLDVFETEPLRQDSPLWAHPRVTVTPHNAAVSEPDATARYIADEIRRLEAGEAPRNVVDRRRGY
jgi:glyoxylate/hydroxypyruvate reductase